MVHEVTTSINAGIKNYFPYPVLTGSYTSEQRARYIALCARWRPIFWILAMLYMACFIAPIYLGIHGLYEAFWDAVKERGDVCFLSLNGSEIINAAIFDIGFCFPMASILTLRVFYPFEYRSILDFISEEDKIDNLKLGRWMVKWFFVIGAIYFVYGFSTVTLLKKDSIYVKTVTDLPHTILYKNVSQIVDCEYFASNQDPAVAEPLHRYWIESANGERTVLSGDESLHVLLNLLSKRTGKTITLLKAR